MNARSLLLGLAAVAALTSGLTSGAAAQTILPPAGHGDTAVRANVGINVANFATQAQLSGYATQGQLSSVDNRVIITQNHVTNLGNQVNTAGGGLGSNQTWVGFSVGRTESGCDEMSGCWSNNVPGDRNVETWYQNTTGKPIAIHLFNQNGNARILVGPNTGSYSFLSGQTGQSSSWSHVSTIVPANHYYYVPGPIWSAPAQWLELR
jgi:hypothetical protein